MNGKVNCSLNDRISFYSKGYFIASGFALAIFSQTLFTVVRHDLNIHHFLLKRKSLINFSNNFPTQFGRFQTEKKSLITLYRTLIRNTCFKCRDLARISISDQIFIVQIFASKFAQSFPENWLRALSSFIYDTLRNIDEVKNVEIFEILDISGSNGNDEEGSSNDSDNEDSEGNSCSASGTDSSASDESSEGQEVSKLSLIFAQNCKKLLILKR